MDGNVVSVGRSDVHGFSKPPCEEIEILAGLGVAGDTHAGVQVQHRSRVAKDPTQPNLRQIHLFHREMMDEVAAQGFDLAAGDIGENVLTRGLDLLALPEDTLLHLGPDAVVRVTGLRNPCSQLDKFRPGLMRALLGRDVAGGLVLKAGIMAVVLQGGRLRAGDRLRAELPPGPHRRLERV